MGIFSSIFKGVKTLFSGAKKASETVNPILETVGSLRGMFPGKVKIPQIPTPGGAEMGLRQKEFMDAAYPGTTVHERLGSSQGYGSSGAGAIIGASKDRQTTESNIRNQRKMQIRQLIQDFQLRNRDVKVKERVGEAQQENIKSQTELNKARLSSESTSSIPRILTELFRGATGGIQNVTSIVGARKGLVDQAKRNKKHPAKLKAIKDFNNPRNRLLNILLRTLLIK